MRMVRWTKSFDKSVEEAEEMNRWRVEEGRGSRRVHTGGQTIDLQCARSLQLALITLTSEWTAL